LSLPLISIFFCTAIFSCILTAVMRAVAPSLGMVDHPDKSRKLHKAPTPLLGGVAIFLAFVSMLFVTSYYVPEIFNSANKVHWILAVCSAAMVCLLGILDDKVSLSPKIKLFGQILSCLPFVFSGGIVSEIGFSGFSFDLGSFAIPFTILWLITCINVINLLDGLDGLAASVCVISASSIAVIASLSGQFEISAISLIFISALLGFLIHNLPPARIFMGDAGSMMIGFMIGALALDASLKETTALSLVVPIGLIGIPLFDTIMAIFRRFLTGKSVGEADRRHLHHRLTDAGLSKTTVLMGICFLCVSVNGLAILAFYTQLDAAVVIGGLALVGLLIVYDIFGRHEYDLILRVIKARLHSSRIFKSYLPLKFLNLTHKSKINNWRMIWTGICDSLKGEEAAQIEFQCWSTKANSLVFSDIFTYGACEVMRSQNFWQSKYSLKIDDTHVVTVNAAGTNKPGHDSRNVRNISPELVCLCHTFPIEILNAHLNLGPETITSRNSKKTESFTQRRAA
jgi:UDP-GlcNAc:undecaprenyl-phosphate/decaprenyl-phosphate GlcNAc-1-phosphate transferase